MKIHDEFKALIPPLSEDEFNQLEKNCLKDGILESIKTWRGYIIDGHNRYEIAQRNNLDYDTFELEFESEDAVKVWMIDNQKGRRNITDGWKWELAQTKKRILEAKGREKYEETVGRPNKSLSTIDNDFQQEKHNTQTEIAKELGWSTGKVAMADKVWTKAEPEVKEKIKSGETTINQAYQKIKLEEKKENLKKTIEQRNDIKPIERKPLIYLRDAIEYLKEFENDSIDLLFTDPPYSTDVEDIKTFSETWLNIALQKVKPNGRAYICIGAYPIELQSYLNVLLAQDKFILDNPLIWTYRNTLGVTPKMKYNLNYQIILHLYSEKSAPLDTSITNEMFSVQDINAPDGRIGNRYHTWQKPDELARRFIFHASKENDLVVDPFACTGTFLIQANKLNRLAYGCDNSFDNLKIAEDRGCTIIGK